jgi:hypothetical protein
MILTMYNPGSTPSSLMKPLLFPSGESVFYCDYYTVKGYQGNKGHMFQVLPEPDIKPVAGGIGENIDIEVIIRGKIGVNGFIPGRVDEGIRVDEIAGRVFKRDTVNEYVFNMIAISWQLQKSCRLHPLYPVQNKSYPGFATDWMGDCETGAPR